jgi:hypothetical protein
MIRHPICKSIHAAILLGVTALAGCGSEASSSASGIGPSNTLRKDDPPPRPQTKEACDACGGLWAVHGILPEKSCICRTSDGGEPCVDGRQCVGQCLVDRDAKFEVTEESEPPRGFYIGTCSVYDTTFGCHRVIPPGMDNTLPLTAEEAAPTLCID